MSNERIWGASLIDGVMVPFGPDDSSDSVGSQPTDSTGAFDMSEEDPGDVLGLQLLAPDEELVGPPGAEGKEEETDEPQPPVEGEGEGLLIPADLQAPPVEPQLRAMCLPMLELLRLVATTDRATYEALRRMVDELAEIHA